jgi:hypothetical protein
MKAADYEVALDAKRHCNCIINLLLNMPDGPMEGIEPIDLVTMLKPIKLALTKLVDE